MSEPASPPRPSPPAFIRRPVRLFRLKGIDVFLDWSWLLLVVVNFQFRRHVYSSPIWNLVECLALVVLVILHELGHAFACRSVGGHANQILLWPLGGVTFTQPPPRPGATLWTTAAGPLVNLALVPVTAGIAAAAYYLAPGLPHDVRTFLIVVATVNLVLLVYNLLPFYPLDGGQMLRSVLWYFVGRARSLRYASVIGFIGAAAIGALALHGYSIWWFALAGFGAYRSYRAYQQSTLLAVIEAMPRREGYRCPHCSAPPPRERIWRSPCGNVVDAFAGPCFRCGDPVDPVGCIECGRGAPASEWEIPASRPVWGDGAQGTSPESFPGPSR